MSKKLKATKVYRGGQSAGALKDESPKNITLSSKRKMFKTPRKKNARRKPYTESGFQLEFSSNAKGGGETIYHVYIGIEDYPTLLETMFEVNQEKTMRAVSDSIRKNIQKEDFLTLLKIMVQVDRKAAMDTILSEALVQQLDL